MRKKIVKKIILMISIVVLTTATLYPTVAKAFEPSIDGFYLFYDNDYCYNPAFTSLGYATLEDAFEFCDIVMALSFSWEGATGTWCYSRFFGVFGPY